MFKFFLFFLLSKILLSEHIQQTYANNPKNNKNNVTIVSKLIGENSTLNSTYLYNLKDQINLLNNTAIQNNAEKLYLLDEEKHFLKRKDKLEKSSDLIVENRKRLIKPSKNNNASSEEFYTPHNQKLIESHKKNIYIDFELVINDFESFEPKTGMIEFDAKLKFKWWDIKSSSSSMSSAELDDEIVNLKNYKFSPSLKFFDEKNVKLIIKNQIYSFNNVETYFERKKETQQSLLAKFEKFKTNNNQAVAAALLGSNNDVYMSSYKNISLNKKVIMTKVFRHYSYLEQNVTLKFKCKSDINNPNEDFILTDSSPLDTSHFPFDSHECELNFDIIASLTNSDNQNIIDEHNPVFLFTSLVPDQPNRIEIDNSMFDFYNYNKLVRTPSNYSWISKEWLFKKMTIFYSNLTTLNNSPLSSYLASTNSSSDDQNEKIDHYLISRKGLIDNGNKTSNKSPSNLVISDSILPRINAKFYIYRRREPQVYIFVLPLVLFTLITFLVFFLPTSNTNEKTIIAFLNFVSLLAFNIYLFKLVIYTYDFMKIPLMLQYSNCLMVIQLGVLAYTCLVKSVYHYGFLTFNSISFTSMAEDAFRQIFYLNNDQLHHQHHQSDQKLMAITCGQSNHALDIYSQVDRNLKYHNNKLNSNNNSMNSTGSNKLLDKSIDKIKEENGLVIYHGCEQIETGTECVLNATDTQSNNSHSQKNHCSNRSTESIKKRLSSGAFLKLDDSIDEIEEDKIKSVKNLKTALENTNDENLYSGYNNIESAIGTATGSRCLCNAMETDADCCNSEIELGQILNCNGNIQSGAGTINNDGINCNNDPEKNKLIAIRGDFLGNISICKQNINETNSNKKNIELKNSCRNIRMANDNWMLANFCCGGHQHQVSPCQNIKNIDAEKPVYSPSPVCEHVRSADTHKRNLNNSSSSSKQKCSPSLCTSNATTRQLLPPECFDYSSRLKETKDRKTEQERNISLILKQNINNKVSSLQTKNDFFNSHLYHQLQHQNSINQLEFRNASLASGNEVSKLNLQVQKLIKIEELFIREKIQRDEWKRKARICDGICCLFVFFLLIVCSAFIFIILPNFKTNSLMD